MGHGAERFVSAVVDYDTIGMSNVSDLIGIHIVELLVLGPIGARGEGVLNPLQIRTIQTLGKVDLQLKLHARVNGSPLLEEVLHQMAYVALSRITASAGLALRLALLARPPSSWIHEKEVHS